MNAVLVAEPFHETLAARLAAPETVRIARKNGASVIGLSGHRSSPLVKLCDVVLIVETLENTDLYTPTISRIASLLVIDILAAGVSLRRDSGHEARLVRMKSNLTAMRTGGRVSAMRSASRADIWRVAHICVSQAFRHSPGGATPR